MNSAIGEQQVFFLQTNIIFTSDLGIIGIFICGFDDFFFVCRVSVFFSIKIKTPRNKSASFSRACQDASHDDRDIRNAHIFGYNCLLNYIDNDSVPQKATDH